MKKLYTLSCLLLALIVSASPVKSQIKVSYNLPDIAAPGMNVYMEFIAPHDEIGSFGADTTFLNVPGDTLRFEFVNSGDAQKITFGPLVVSWQGRMIATQVFVNPNVNPNSWDWSVLNPQFVVPVRINKNGNISNIINIYLVQPFPFGDKSASAERVLGEGTLGKRSPRGAMIVDSMVLAGGIYYVSPNDCDPLTPGNQAYLPFALIAKYDIKGTVGTRISVDGGRGRLENAGPGGGGGGGRFYDAGFLCDNSRIGEDGGAGFTGGGAGGRNRSGMPSVTDALKNAGTGSYEDGSQTKPLGYSLNGVPPSITTIWESAGGGTGHPFGVSGYQCDGGSTCNAPGQYGGGSGYRQNTAGGSGGHATDGQGNANSGGKAVGNLMLVPLSGGSGAASGNPQSGCNFSGSGGGGGGAILVFARNVSNVEVSAKGAEGQNGVGASNGGGGSGGSITTASKLSFNNGANPSIFLEGGKAGGLTAQYGGWGRIRRDSPVWNIVVGGIAPIPYPSIYFQGPSTDTTKYIKPDIPFTINGSKRNTDSLLLMLKAESGIWQKVAVIPSGSTAWNIQLSLPKTDKLYYFVAMQYVPNPNKSAQYSAEPDFVLSQAAANIFIVEDLPEIASKDTVFVDSLLACDGQQKRFKAWIHNIGTADLILSSSSFAKGYFSLATPINNLVIPPLDSSEIEIVYNYNPAHPALIIDSLIINHNDILYDRPQPWIIRFELKILPLDVRNNFYSINKGVEIPFFMAGVDFVSFPICLDETIIFKTAVHNKSSEPLNLERIDKSNPNFSTLITGDRLILPDDTCTYYITVKAVALGSLKENLKFKFLECNNYLDSIRFDFNIIESEFTFLDDGVFPDTRVGQFKEKTIRLKNTGTANAQINTIAQPGNGYSIISTAPPLPLNLKAGEEISIVVRFAPLASGDPVTATLQVISSATDTTCSGMAELLLTAKAVESKVQLSKYVMDFDTLYTCISAVDTVFVSNPASSTLPVLFTKAAEITGSSMFQIKYQPPMQVSIAPGDSAMIIVEYQTGSGGTHAGQLVIFTDDLSTPEIYLQLAGTRDEFDITVNPEPLDLGDVPLGFTVADKIRITNNGILPLTMTNIDFDNDAIVGSFTPTNAVLPANGGFVDIDVDLYVSLDLSSIERYNITFAECSRGSVQLIKLNKLIADASTNSPLNYGVLSGCEDSIMVADFTNTGNAILFINSYQITGADAALFDVRGQSHTFLPDTLFPNETFSIVIAFDPKTSTNGIKNGKLVVQATINGLPEQLEIDLIGEKRSAVIANPSIVDFGNVVVGTGASKTLKISNAGFFDVDILSIIFPVKYGAEMTAGPDHTGAKLLASSGEVTFTIDFLPVNIGAYNDILFLNLFYRGCYETVPIALIGNSLPGRKISISVPKLDLVDPREKNYSIPIFAQVDTDTINNFVIDTLEFRWNRSIFYPRGVTGGTVLYSKLDGDTRVFGVSLDNVAISAINSEQKIAEIVGDVLLGSVQFSSIEISSFVHHDFTRVSEIDTTWGSISIEVCPDGGDRLLNVVNNPAGITVNPNPINGIANININCVDVGEYSLELYDVLGNNIKILDAWTLSLNDQKTRTITSNFNGLSDGVYMIRLTTPTSFYSKIVAITK